MVNDSRPRVSLSEVLTIILADRAGNRAAHPSRVSLLEVLTIILVLLTLLTGLPSLVEWGSVWWGLPAVLALSTGALATLVVWLAKCGRRWLWCSAVLTLVATLGTGSHGYLQRLPLLRIEADVRERRAYVDKVLEPTLRSCLWLAYEPPAYDPQATPQPRFASVAQISEDLRALVRDKDLARNKIGIITFTANGTNARIPEIARSPEFSGVIHAVIMGVQDLGDEDQLHALVAARQHVDAYCIGHMFTDAPWEFPASEVAKRMTWVREQTGKPVATTLRPGHYAAYPAIVEASDFLLPDVHTDWHCLASPDAALSRTELLVKAVKALRETPCADKPVLLKMVSFPAAGAPGATVAKQEDFYRGIYAYTERGDLPPKVYLSYFSAFDLPWKSPARGWGPGEQYTGLFDQFGRRRPAVEYISYIKVPGIPGMDAAWSPPGS